MQVAIVCVGKIKEAYLKNALLEYEKRLSSYIRLTFIEVQEEKIPDDPSATEISQGLIKEGKRILENIPKDSYVISLAIQGDMETSEGFAEFLNQSAIHGNSKITFIIGGSHGLSNEVLTHSSKLLSFSKMTFPHQLMRVILLEQIYRSFKIIRNEPYHK